MRSGIPEVGGEEARFQGVLLILGELGVGGAVRGIKGSDVEAATLAVGEVMRATNGVVDELELATCWVIFLFLDGTRGVHPGQRRRF